MRVTKVKEGKRGHDYVEMGWNGNSGCIMGMCFDCSVNMAGEFNE
jgi:hypothetical protein